MAIRIKGNIIIPDVVGDNITSGIVSVGINAIGSLTTGTHDVAIGLDALASNTGGSQNTAIGTNALGAITTGNNNIGIGYNAGGTIVDGYNNTVIGNVTLGASENNIVLIGAGSTERIKVDDTGLYINGEFFTGGGADSGFSGYSGYSGKNGASGYSGYSGELGASGYSGVRGLSGYSGEAGPIGSSGYSGELGQSGYSGESGQSGYSGTSGFSGYSGESGQSGYSGTSGFSGYSGESSFSGYSGESGQSGYSGESGQSGYSGESGQSGYSGTSGFSGYSGTSGFSGYSGEVGLSGYSGAVGVGLTAGSTAVGYINYNGTTSAAGQLDGGSTTPTSNTRLNYNGYLYATKFYGDGSSLGGIISGATISAASAPVTYYVGLSAATTGTWVDARVDAGNLYYTSGDNTLYATNYNSASDVNLKEDIVTITNSTNIVEQLRGVKFKWKNTGKYSYGVIAQEVEAVLPEVVNTVADKKSVNYSSLIGVLIESVKQIAAENQALTGRVSALEQQLAAMLSK